MPADVGFLFASSVRPVTVHETGPVFHYKPFLSEMIGRKPAQFAHSQGVVVQSAQHDAAGARPKFTKRFYNFSIFGDMMQKLCPLVRPIGINRAVRRTRKTDPTSRVVPGKKPGRRCLDNEQCPAQK